MGSNMSTGEDSRASVATAPSTTVSHAVFSPTYNQNKEQPNGYSANSRSRMHPSAALLPSSRVSNAHRVISFHSSPSFRGYLEASKASNTLIVIDFANGWCGRCRYMDPILQEFAVNYTTVEFVKIDIDQLSDVSQDYGVQTTPTFMLVKKGRVIDRVDGAKKEELQRKIEIHSVV